MRLKDIEYGEVNGRSLRLDAGIPDGKGPHPAAILVHGGGWMRGDRVWNMEPLFPVLADAGIAWFSISYRLASDFMNIGSAVADVRQATRYVRENATKYGIDPQRLALIGESAGAHLSSLAAFEDPKQVAAVVALYGPADLELLAKTSPVVPPQIRSAVEASGFAELLLGHLRSLSPVQHVRSDAPPFLLIHGTADHIVPFEQSVEFQNTLRAAGAVCDLISVPGGGHGMRYWNNPAQTRYRADLVAWLHHRLAA